MSDALNHKGTDRTFSCCGVEWLTSKKGPPVVPCPECSKLMVDKRATKSELRRLRSLITVEIKSKGV